jgi:hypothetical protein
MTFGDVTSGALTNKLAETVVVAYAAWGMGEVQR